MSTKNLARTPLEAGHYDGKNQRRNGKNHAPRRTVRQQERQAEKAYEPEDMDFHVDEPSTRTRNSDKLGAVKRWIMSQCGRPWNKVYSEIAERFDFNTMAGRHILLHLKQYVDFGYDHELYSRWRGGPREFPSRWSPCYVDKNGLLQRNKNYRQPSDKQKENRRQAQAVYERKKKIDAWMNGRSIGREGGLLFWYTFETREVTEWCEDPNCRREHQHSGDRRLCVQYTGKAEPFRFHIKKITQVVRGEKLSKKDMEFLNSFPEETRPGCTVINGRVY